MRAIQGCNRLPTYESPHTDAIRMWTSVGSESDERRPTEDSSRPIGMIGRLVNVSFNLQMKNFYIRFYDIGDFQPSPRILVHYRHDRVC